MNKVYLAGIVVERPTMKYASEIGKVISVKIEINRKDIARKETITLISPVEEVMKEVLRTVRVGDFFYTEKARIVTTNYDKNVEVVCPHCQEVSYIHSRAERTDIHFTEFSSVRVQPDQEVYGMNKILLLGEVCSDMNYRTTGLKSYVKYKVAVNRLGKYRTSAQSSDYPFIVSFGKEADAANEHLKVSSIILAEGSVQEREIKQKVNHTCESCGNTINTKKESYVREIITSNVKYLDKITKESAVGEVLADSEESTE